jgi:hypothetical protein
LFWDSISQGSAVPQLSPAELSLLQEAYAANAAAQAAEAVAAAAAGAISFAGRAMSGEDAHGVLCEDAAPKLVGRIVRREAVPTLVKCAGDAQAGSVPGGGTDYPSTFVRGPGSGVVATAYRWPSCSPT